MGITAFAYKSPRKGRGGKSKAVDIIINALQIEEAKLAGQNDAQHLTDPNQLDGIIKKYQSALTSGAVTDASDKQKIEEIIARKTATFESLKQDDSVAQITSALNFDTKDARYLYANRYANSPLAYLKSFHDSYTALQQVGQSVVDQMNSQGKVSDADKLSKLLKTYNPIVDTFKSISPYYKIDEATGAPVAAEGSAGSYIDEQGNSVDIPASEQLKQYAVVYQTDAFGRVKDMKVLPVDQVPDGFVPIVDGRDFSNDEKGKKGANSKKGNNVTMDGMQVFLNRQSSNGREFVALGSKQQVPVSNGSPVSIGNAVSLDGSTKKVSAALLHSDNQNFDDPNFRKTIIPADAAITTTPGEYFRFADGRVFRNNDSGKIDEISPDALENFADYNPASAIRVPTIDSKSVYGRSGRVITQKDFTVSYAPLAAGQMGPASPVKTLQPQASVGVPSPDPAAAIPPQAQPQGEPGAMAPAGLQPVVRTNRNQGQVRPTGSDQFNKSTSQLFSGVPRP